MLYSFPSLLIVRLLLSGESGDISVYRPAENRNGYFACRHAKNDHQELWQSTNNGHWILGYKGRRITSYTHNRNNIEKKTGRKNGEQV